MEVWLSIWNSSVSQSHNVTLVRIPLILEKVSVWGDDLRNPLHTDNWVFPKLLSLKSANSVNHDQIQERYDYQRYNPSGNRYIASTSNKIVLPLLPLGRYLLPLITVNRYQPTDSRGKLLFVTMSRNVSIVRYRMSLVTILLLDMVIIHWIQGKWFRENSTKAHKRRNIPWLWNPGQRSKTGGFSQYLFFRTWDDVTFEYLAGIYSSGDGVMGCLSI